MRLKDKVAIVTGAAKGIGEGIARVFVKEGAKVVLVDWDDKVGPKTTEDIRKSGGDVIFVKCDVSKEDQVKAVIQKTLEKYGRIDVLVNNAGLGVYKTILDASPEDFDTAIGVNLKGPFLFCKYVIPYMEKQGKGAIVNISSVHSFAAVNGVLPYATSKGGLTQMTRNLAIDHGPTIRVNSIAPGWVLTPLIQGIFDSNPDPEGFRKAVEKRQVMKRIGVPEDIGHAAAFLASDEASFITGVQLYVDGGMTAQLETW
jgi:NAD(P)-dependent dehydrogenase (short-subunit alcohol dehydrogenase family)